MTDPLNIIFDDFGI